MTGGQAGSGTGGQSGGAACDADRFAGASDFGLPDVGPVPPYVAFAMMGGLGNLSGDVTQQWATVDLDGDDRPDLVRTYVSSDATIGVSSWLVYKNNGSGFGPPQSFALPDVGAEAPYVPFSTMGGIGAVSANLYHRWATFDLDGDGKPDLVRTYVGSDPNVGLTKWLVYKNNGSGFGPPQSFTLPAVGASAPYLPFLDPGGQTELSANVYHRWVTVDLDGDGKPDLVRTYLTTDPAVGVTKWLVHKNTGSGFAAPTDFLLPDVGASPQSVPFGDLGGLADLAFNVQHRWVTADLGGDGRPDLVRTYLTTDPTVGVTKWLVYKNNGNGFGASTDFLLPDVGPSAPYLPFAALGGEGNLAANVYHRWVTVDLDADGKPDLIRTLVTSDTAVGNTKWLFYRGACAP